MNEQQTLPLSNNDAKDDASEQQSTPDKEPVKDSYPANKESNVSKSNNEEKEILSKLQEKISYLEKNLEEEKKLRIEESEQRKKRDIEIQNNRFKLVEQKVKSNLPLSMEEKQEYINYIDSNPELKSAIAKAALEKELKVENNNLRQVNISVSPSPSKAEDIFDSMVKRFKK